MIIAQILHDKAHWIFDPAMVFGKNEIPQLPPDAMGNQIMMIDITDSPDIQEGWDYNADTGEFTEPIPPEPIEPQPIEPTAEEKLLQQNEILMLALAEQYEKNIAIEENQQTIMLALADLYESQPNVTI